MKKFLTLALALVMALALAAPAMAFVPTDYEYGADSKYDLDFYLIDYDTGGGLFAVTGGAFTSLPAADRGYVKNEMIGAVVEVLVPGYNGGDDATLEITSEDVALVDELAIPSRKNADLIKDAEPDTTKAAYKYDAYDWSPVNSSKMELVNEGKFKTAAMTSAEDRGLFENDSSKDVTAAWLVRGRVIADGATITATLSNGATYNADLKADAGVPTKYKINGNKYDVELFKTDDGYVYVIRPEGKTNGAEVRIYTNSKYVTNAMVFTNNTKGNVIDTTNSVSAKYTFDFDGTYTDGDPITIKVGGKTYEEAWDTDAATTLAALAAKLTDGGVANSTATYVTSWSKTQYTTGTSIVLIAPLDAAAPSATDKDGAVEPTVAAQKKVVVEGAGDVEYYWVHTNDKLYIATVSDPLVKPVKTDTAASSVSRGFLDDVLADFNLDPANVGGTLKPAYLGNYKMGIIEEITLEIQPWQAYVSIPDIEVIDPPKTGDAATLAGFVMIVLAAAGVVVFKKVRA